MTYSKETVLERCNAICKNTLMETLSIEFVDLTEDTLVARMPVTPKVHQPDGVLHGGATVALAESVGSAGACAASRAAGHGAARQRKSNTERPGAGVASGSLSC